SHKARNVPRCCWVEKTRPATPPAAAARAALGPAAGPPSSTVAEARQSVVDTQCGLAMCQTGRNAAANTTTASAASTVPATLHVRQRRKPQLSAPSAAIAVRAATIDVPPTAKTNAKR